MTGDTERVGSGGGGDSDGAFRGNEREPVMTQSDAPQWTGLMAQSLLKGPGP